MVPDRQKGWTDGRTDGRTDDAKTISLRLRRGIIKRLCAERRLRSACASAQSDQSLLCAQWLTKDPSFSCATANSLIRPSLEVIKLEHSRLKIKRNDWLLADMCPQAANHCALLLYTPISLLEPQNQRGTGFCKPCFRGNVFD